MGKILWTILFRFSRFKCNSWPIRSLEMSFNANKDGKLWTILNSDSGCVQWKMRWIGKLFRLWEWPPFFRSVNIYIKYMVVIISSCQLRATTFLSTSHCLNCHCATAHTLTRTWVSAIELHEQRAACRDRNDKHVALTNCCTYPSFRTDNLDSASVQFSVGEHVSPQKCQKKVFSDRVAAAAKNDNKWHPCTVCNADKKKTSISPIYLDEALISVEPGILPIA